MTIPIIPPIVPAVTAASGASDAIASTVSNAIPGLDAFQQAAAVLSNPEWWKRIGVGALGIMLMWWGVLILLASSERVQSAVGTAAGAAIGGPTGAAVGSSASEIVP